jgi:hypothetical protein
MSIKDIVKVVITREATPVRRASFGIPLLLGANKVFTERAKEYTDLEGILADGFADTDAEYIAAEKIFSQNPRVEEIVIGRRDVDKVAITVSNVLPTTEYTCTINGTDFSFTSTGSPTALTIAAGLVAAINGGTEPVTATDLLTGEYELDADVSGVAYTVSVDVDQTIQPYTPSDTIVNDIVAVEAENNDWYMIEELLGDTSEQIELAAWVETKNKLFGITSDDNNIVDQDVSTDTTSIAALLKSAEYDRTYVAYWNSDYLKVADLGNNKYLSAAWDGVQLPKDPGSSTWAHKTIKAIQALTLNSVQAKNATDKKANLYLITGADGRTRFGTVASGEYIDIMRGIDWLQARLEEDIFTLLATNEKIPYTSAGITTVEGVIKAVLSEAVTVGFLEQGFTVTVPQIENVDPIDRANRVLKGITFKAVPAGAIHIVEIQGEVSVFDEGV